MTPFGSRLSALLDHLGDFRNFQRPFLILLATFSMFYLGQLASFSLSIDDEVAALREDAAVWVAQGRWLVYLIERFIISQPSLPFLPLFLFGALASAGYMILVKAHGYQLDKAPVFLLFTLFAGFPTLYFILNFAGNMVGLGAGILLACSSLHLFDGTLRAFAGGGAQYRKEAGRFALQAILGAAAVGAYQSLILLIAAGCCGLFILHALRRPAIPLREIVLVHAYLACNLLASMALALLISRGLQWMLGIEPAYVGQFVRIDQLLDKPAWVLDRTVKQYWQVYGGKRAVYGFRYWTFPTLILLGMFALLARVPRRAACLLAALVYLLGITAVPFALNVITSGFVPFRAMVGVPYVFWFFAAAAILSHIPAVRRIAAILIVIVAVQCLYTFSEFQATRRLAFEHDVQLAAQIYGRISTQVPAFDVTKTYRADFYGKQEFKTVYREIEGSTLSASFFEWDGGNPHRIAAFMKILGYSNIATVDNATRSALLPVFQEMPVWPAEGSVRVVDGVILVRLGPEPGLAHLRLMPSKTQP
ncbi:MAG TPA: glucosyltransferase domain-containing protein [Dongiaceae bacterium]|nr:glucosyltransferase domain-containing protein [Dongiaceae bacterium]